MQISNILSSVQTFDVVLPQFQREYVWSKEDAKQLIISLFKNYPTGSLLFWKASGENIPELKGIKVNRSNIGLTSVILDGQQRITTLYLLIKGEIPPYYDEHDITNDPRNLYFNLETGEFQYFMKTKMQDNPLWQKVTDCFDSSKVNAVDITMEYGKKVNDGIENWGNNSLDTNLLSKVNNNLIRLQNIRNIEYHIQIVPSEARIDEAIDVFDRVNSQGTKLTDAELVLTHITGKWPDARSVIKEKIQKLEAEEYHLELDFFTRCMVIALTDSALLNKNSKLNYDRFTKEDYIKAWNKISKSVDYLVPILKHEGLYTSTSDMSTNYVLIPLIAYLLKKEKFTESMKYGFLYWMNLAQIWSRYSGQTNERLDKDVHHVSTSLSTIEDMVREIEDMRGRIEVKSADLEGRGANHPLYRMLYVVTKNKKAIDWANGSPIQGVIGDIYSIQSHHIFPQNFLYK
ncbi:DUF262 domain-containing protein, partial [Methanocalculus sp.]|uniref:DUF262 domain-containing protein n=1 Tax=Methanocalculus sp. TaxID=2004547 RepID=UPI00260A9828